MTTRRVLILLLASSFFFLFAGCASAPQKTIDLRFQTENDRQPIPRPEESSASEMWDQVYNQFLRQVYRGLYLPNLTGPVEAENVNDWDEVADSSWFTNRIGKNPTQWSSDKIIERPQPNPPQLDQPWRVIRGKTDGVTPGFTVLDAKNNLYFIKFDPPENQELSTAAEVVSSLLLHAAGFNVTSNFVYRLPPSQFILDKKAKISGKYGKKRPMTEEDLKSILAQVKVDGQGKARLVASLALPGKPIGPFFFEGTRSDDANDDVYHENRRELRGYHLFSAWLNNTDVRFQNTLDMYQGKKGEGYVKHYFLDFGTSLGAGGNRAKTIKTGYEYAVDFSTIGYQFVTLGSNRPYWEKVSPSPYPSVGVFESKVFDPVKWRSQYANRAFELITPRDAFWASKILARFSDDHIRAAVIEAQYSDPNASNYVTQTLSERRNKIVHWWFSQMTPLDEFTIEKKDSGEHILKMSDLAVAHRLSNPSQRRYRLKMKSEELATLEASANSDGWVEFQLPSSTKKNLSFHLEILESEKSVGKGIMLQRVCLETCVISKVVRHY